MGEDGAGGADVVDIDEGAGGGLHLGLVEQFVELGDAGGGAGGKRPRGNRVAADALGAELGGDLADGGFQRGLGDSHDVVVLHHLLGAVVGHG